MPKIGHNLFNLSDIYPENLIINQKDIKQITLQICNIICFFVETLILLIQNIFFKINHYFLCFWHELCNIIL